MGSKISTGLVNKEHFLYDEEIHTLTIKPGQQLTFILKGAVFPPKIAESASTTSPEPTEILLEIEPLEGFPKTKKANYLLLQQNAIEKLKTQFPGFSLVSQTTHDGSKEVPSGILSWYN